MATPTVGASLKGKVAIITGASSGIGAETARYFASLGCYVSITGRNMDNLTKVAQECEERGLPKDKVLVVQGDLSQDEVVKKIIDQTLTHFGRIDVLVNQWYVFDSPGFWNIHQWNGRDYVIPVWGYYCKPCRQFYQSVGHQGSVLEAHCKTMEHFQAGKQFVDEGEADGDVDYLSMAIAENQEIHV